ncbi:MAG: hypothetical protein AB4368_28240 [Xenococcaceae cyanobacterium]
MATKMKITSLLTVFGSASLFTVGLLANSSPASAARFAEGTFNISGGTVEIESFGTIRDVIGIPNDNPFTDFDFTNIGAGNPDGFGQFTVGGGTGDFDPFLASGTPPIAQSGEIQDLSRDDLLNLPGDLRFLEFTFQNPGNTFDLQTLGFSTFDETDTGITISVGGTGIFNLASQDTDMDGTIDTDFLPTPGDITFGTEITFGSLDGATDPAADINSLDEFLDYLSVPGNTISGISWSGEASLREGDIPPIPESSNLVALLGFGLIGGTVIIRKRKHKIG